jgi:RNA polymerase sigma-70 factor (ECF subfamily)
MLGNREDAEEAVQDIFLKAHRGLAEFRGESTIRTWLYRITVNTCLTRLRNRRNNQESAGPEGAETEYQGEVIADDSGNPEARFIEQDLNDFVMRALELISAEEKEILLLYHIDELKYEEIGTVLGVPIGTVCARIYRARKKLRSAMNNVRKEVRSS